MILILCGDCLDRYDARHIGLFLIKLQRLQCLHCNLCKNVKHYKHLKTNLSNPYSVKPAANDASNALHNLS